MYFCYINLHDVDLQLRNHREAAIEVGPAQDHLRPGEGRRIRERDRYDAVHVVSRCA